jgi:hypothetical protein
LFFFFLDDAEPFEDDALDDREARLEDVKLVVSREGWEMVAGLVSGFGRGSWPVGFFPLSWEFWEVGGSGPAGRGFLYLSLGIRVAGDWAVKSTFGAMANDADLGACTFAV